MGRGIRLCFIIATEKRFLLLPPYHYAMVTMHDDILMMGRSRGWLLEPEAKEICRRYGIPIGEWRLAKSKADAIRASKELSYPVAIKLVSPDVVHKSDVGGVKLDIEDDDGAGLAFEELDNVCKTRGYRFEGVLIERMAQRGIETIVGAKRDIQFGPVMMFGLGGIFVEVFKDVSFRVSPISDEDAKEMITELKAYPILKGIRGRPPSDIDSIAGLLVKVSKIMNELELVNEIDLNPVIVYERGFAIVDARIILRQ